MKDGFVFGTQYLRGASPDRSQWARDMENMKRMGFNTIRAWLVWNACEKAEGEIDFDYITSFLDCARKNELDVGLLFHLHACPEWAVKKYSKYFYVSEDNLPFEPAIRANTPSGGWPGLCFDNPEVRDMEERFIRGVISETKKYDNVAFYEPMNEPHQWIDLARRPNGMYCYCPATTREFRSWLKQKYGTVEELNRAWGNFYTDFSDVRPPRWISSYSDYTDFRLFTMDNVAREVQFRAGIIRECDTRPVIAHAWGGGAITCGQLGGMAFDDWKNAKVFDKWGFSAFPQSTKDCAALAMGCDATRCAAGGKEFWQSELTAGFVGTGLNQRGRVSDNTFMNFSLESIRHGAKGLLYWQYRKERFGAEFGGYAMTDNAGGPTNLSRCAEKLCGALQKNSDIFTQGKLPKAEVALVFSIRSYLAAWLSNGRNDNRMAVESMNGYYRMLWEENIPVDILHEEQSFDPGAYKAIILPCAYAVSPKMAERLEEFVRGGGTLISDPYFGAFDESMRLSYTVPGFGFDKVFGLCEDDLTQESECVLKAEGRRELLKGNRMKELFKNVIARVLCTYEDDSPAVCDNAYGKGHAVISGVNLGLSYAGRASLGDDINTEGISHDTEVSKRIVLDILSKCGVKGNICSAEGVKVSLYRADDFGGVVLINSTDRKADGVIRLDKAYTKASEELGSAFSRIEGEKLNFVLEPGASAIIRLNK